MASTASMPAAKRPARPSRRPAPATTPSRVGQQVREIWDANADFWDERMAEGNLTHRHLLAPTVERLLALRRGEEVLEIACGNGQLSRRMADLGARVVAVDISEGMLRHARARSRKYRSTIDYRRLDAADPAALRQLGSHRFAAVVCNMAIMDMAEIRPLAAAVRSLLTPTGRFVFSITHPCFNGTGMRRVMEDEDQAGTMVERAGVFVYRYRTPTTAEGLAMIGQPRAQLLFDRSLNDLFRPFFRGGLVLDALEEPRFPLSIQPNRTFSWISFREIPQVLIVRLRPLSRARSAARRAGSR
jgi:SAM-dependent methyltransferase